MEGKNCPNCGAPLEADICKCPYCGTSYFDISALSIGDREPFYLKLKLADPIGEGYTVITAYVIAEPSLEINYGPEWTYANIDGQKRQFITCPEYQFHLGFCSIYDTSQRTLPIKIEHIKE